MKFLSQAAQVAVPLALSLAASAAGALPLSFVGTLDPTNPNDVFLADFRLDTAQAVTVQTWGFGGGLNAAGAPIAAGGFDPYVSLFAGRGAGATFLASNDDGRCPPGTGAPACADSTLVTGLLPAGDYTLALTLPFNHSFAENLGTGTLGDGFIGLDASFDDGACAGGCGSRYAVDITGGAVTTPVPEPSRWALVAAGGLLTAWFARRRTPSFRP